MNHKLINFFKLKEFIMIIKHIILDTFLFKNNCHVSAAATDRLSSIAYLNVPAMNLINSLLRS